MAEIHEFDSLVNEKLGLAPLGLSSNIARCLLSPLLHRREFIELAEKTKGLDIYDAINTVHLYFNLDVVCFGLNNIPKTGACIVVANHPTGLADGIAIHKAVLNVRRDIFIVSTDDFIRLLPSLEPVVLPIKVPAVGSDVKPTFVINNIRKAIRSKGVIIVFPAGRRAIYDKNSNQIELPWNSGFLDLLKLVKCPIIPAYIEGKCSFIYRSLHNKNEKIRRVLTLTELANKRNKRYPIIFGNEVDHCTTLVEVNELRNFVIDNLRSELDLLGDNLIGGLDDSIIGSEIAK